MPLRGFAQNFVSRAAVSSAPDSAADGGGGNTGTEDGKGILQLQFSMLSGAKHLKALGATLDEGFYDYNPPMQWEHPLVRSFAPLRM